RSEWPCRHSSAPLVTRTGGGVEWWTARTEAGIEIGGEPGRPVPGGDPMNVLLVTTDQHKATTIGAYGDPLGATPHLDRLATEGTRFARCRTQNPFRQPGRATILTGQYPSTHGVIRNGMDLPLEAAADSVATSFAGAGFATAFFGKAHFASYFPDFPTGSIESVPDSALVPPDWYGPYFGFE